MTIRRKLSELLSRHPGVFYAFKKADLLTHRFAKLAFDRDFDVFKRVNAVLPDPVIMDIGANIGQSALDFARIFRAPRVHSFEPNSSLDEYLSYCKRLIGDLFSYKLVGLSDAPGAVTLYVPRRGKVFIYGEASMHAETFQDPATRARIGDFELEQKTIVLERGDAQGIAPDIVKIDVQGHELTVLRGLSGTIEACSPIIFFERSSADHAVMDELRRYGYEFFVSNGADVPEPFSDASSRINILALPTAPSRRALVAAIMQAA